jgi:hypothetical protein
MSPKDKWNWLSQSLNPTIPFSHSTSLALQQKSPFSFNINQRLLDQTNHHLQLKLQDWPLKWPNWKFHLLSCYS